MPEMNYCMQCGTRLHLRRHNTEGEIPYCDTCSEFRYPVFNTAVSMLVMNALKNSGWRPLRFRSTTAATIPVPTR